MFSGMRGSPCFSGGVFAAGAPAVDMTRGRLRVGWFSSEEKNKERRVYTKTHHVHIHVVSRSQISRVDVSGSATWWI